MIVFNVAMMTYVNVRVNYIWMAKYDDYGKQADSTLSAASFISMFAVGAAVTIWGYSLYLSEENNCQDYPSTTFLLVVMLF